MAIKTPQTLTRVPLGQCHTPPPPGESHDSTVICLNPSFGNSVKISSLFVFLPGLGSYSPEKNIHPPAQQLTELLISWEPVGKGTLRASILSTYPLLFARLEFVMAEKGAEIKPCLHLCPVSRRAYRSRPHISAPGTYSYFRQLLLRPTMLAQELQPWACSAGSLCSF